MNVAGQNVRSFAPSIRVHPLTNETATCHSQLYSLVRAQRVVMVRPTVADSMASRIGRAWHRLLRCISLVRNPGGPSTSQVSACLGPKQNVNSCPQCSSNSPQRSKGAAACACQVAPAPRAAAQPPRRRAA
jgi:hypothetical protein